MKKKQNYKKFTKLLLFMYIKFYYLKQIYKIELIVKSLVKYIVRKYQDIKRYLLIIILIIFKFNGI